MEVSYHSLLRWRERASTYGDEKANDILQKMKKGIELQGEPKFGYTWYNVDNISFLVETNSRRSEIVTVIENEIKKSAEKIALENEYNPVDDEDIVNSFSEIEDKRCWLRQEVAAIDNIFKNKDRTNRQYLLQRKKWLENKLKETKQQAIFTGYKLLEHHNRYLEKQQQKEYEEYQKWYEEDKIKREALI